MRFLDGCRECTKGDEELFAKRLDRRIVITCAIDWRPKKHSTRNLESQGKTPKMGAAAAVGGDEEALVLAMGRLAHAVRS